jgi:hypothetical protein
MKAYLREANNAKPEQRLMRLNALAGGKVLCDLAAEQDYADFMVITLDYEGDTFTPIVGIHTTKWVPRMSPANIQHFWRLDMSELFGEDKVDHDLLRQVIHDIGFAMNDLMARSIV